MKLKTNKTSTKRPRTKKIKRIRTEIEILLTKKPNYNFMGRRDKRKRKKGLLTTNQTTTTDKRSFTRNKHYKI